jgi:glycerate dehydrogenase
MKIVITDGYTLNSGDLSWEKLHALGEVVYYDRTRPEAVAERCREAHVIITNKTPVSKLVIETASNLKVIAVTATGYNIVDTDAAKNLGVQVCNVPGYGTHSVAQHAFALILELTNRVGKHEESVKAGEWVNSSDFSYTKAPIIELKDKILGVVGMGNIGNQAARIAEAFGMRIIHYRGTALGVKSRSVRLDELFSESDFVSLHCPLKPDNHAFVNADLLARMKASAFLVNTSRGQLIHEHDLAEALKNGILAGAGLDVLSKEPPLPENPLLHAPNCLITPHNAWMSFEARQRILNTTIDNIKAALSGKPQNIVV